VALTPIPSTGAQPTANPANATCFESSVSLASRWRDPNCVPFAHDAPFNVPIPPRPRLDTRSVTIIAFYVGLSGGGLRDLQTDEDDESSDYQHPIYFSSPKDPEYKIHCTRSWGRCELEGQVVPIPVGAQPAGGTDAHMAIIDRARRKEYDFWQAARNRNGDVYDIAWGGEFSLYGSGIAGPKGGATAAGFAESEGLIRPEEIAAGAIHHALFMVLPCSSGRYVYPAVHVDHPCTDTSSAASMGARMQLALSDSQIDALPAPTYAKTIWRALAHYGAFYGDSGSRGIQFQTESPLTYRALGTDDPWDRIAARYGVPHRGRYSFAIDPPGIDLTKYLRIIDPCVTKRTC